MKIDTISGQNFQGKVVGCKWFNQKQRKAFKQVRPCLENIMKNKDYDLKIYLFWGKLRISDGKNPEYAEINSHNPDIWISTVKKFINAHEHR